MEYEIHLFSGVATIGECSSYNHAVGGRHAFLLYLKEKENSDFNWTGAIDIVKKEGLNDVQLTKAGKISHERVIGTDNEEFYLSAMNKGAAIVLYSDLVD